MRYDHDVLFVYDSLVQLETGRDWAQLLSTGGTSGGHLDGGGILDHAPLEAISYPLDVPVQTSLVCLAEIRVVRSNAEEHPGHVRHDPLHLVGAHRLLLVRLEFDPVDESGVVLDRDSIGYLKLTGDG